MYYTIHTKKTQITKFHRHLYEKPEPIPTHRIATTEASSAKGKIWFPTAFPQEQTWNNGSTMETSVAFDGHRHGSLTRKPVALNVMDLYNKTKLDDPSGPDSD